MTLAFVAGLVLAIGLAFGFEYLDNRIKTPQELKAHPSGPVPRDGAEPRARETRGTRTRC